MSARRPRQVPYSRQHRGPVVDTGLHASDTTLISKGHVLLLIIQHLDRFSSIRKQCVDREQLSLRKSDEQRDASFNTLCNRVKANLNLQKYLYELKHLCSQLQPQFQTLSRIAVHPKGPGRAQAAANELQQIIATSSATSPRSYFANFRTMGLLYVGCKLSYISKQHAST